MTPDEIRKRRATLIVGSNPEWRDIMNLRCAVQADFKERSFLTSQVFDSILNWKLRKQRRRTENKRVRNPEKLIQHITRCYLLVDHPDEETKLQTKLGVLMSIPGVGLGVSSAILALHEPCKFGIIDFRVWSVLYKRDKRQFLTGDYFAYLSDIRDLARCVECDVQDVDYILWKKYEETDAG
jgi:hypothetical protein